MPPVAPWLLRLVGANSKQEIQRAHAIVRREHERLGRANEADQVAFRGHMESMDDTSVILGTAEDDTPYTIPIAELTRLPSWITAGTGSGKSRLVGGMIEQLAAAALRGAPIAVIMIDAKGESADNFLRSVAALVATLPPHARPGLRERIHTFRFFDSRYLPSWPLLAQIPGVSVESQADAVAEVLNDLVADATIGPRQRATLAAVIALAIESEIPLAALPWLLSSPALVADLAGRSPIHSVRLQLTRFDREPQGSVDGLIARLGTILRVPSLRAAVSGPVPADFGRSFEPGNITTLDFGRADLGARFSVRAMGSLSISALANAAYDPRREARETTTFIGIDEPSLIMTSVAQAQFERLITTGRSFGAGGLMLIHQGPTQLPADLQAFLGTNVALRVIGRSSARDAAASAEWLPKTGRIRRPRSDGRSTGGTFLSEGEEERHWIQEIGKLRERHFLIADRRAPFMPRVIRARDYDPPPWSAIPTEAAELVLQGSQGMPRGQLEAHVREIEDAAAREFTATGGGSRERRSTPDATTPRRGRRREVP
ncbi:MAG: DUF87 domain-containing protein [Polyangiaceae bacterium]